MWAWEGGIFTGLWYGSHDDILDNLMKDILNLPLKITENQLVGQNVFFIKYLECRFTPLIVDSLSELAVS